MNHDLGIDFTQLSLSGNQGAGDNVNPPVYGDGNGSINVQQMGVQQQEGGRPKFYSLPVPVRAERHPSVITTLIKVGYIYQCVLLD